jgi:hypothetical protein
MISGLDLTPIGKDCSRTTIQRHGRFTGGSIHSLIPHLGQKRLSPGCSLGSVCKSRSILPLRGSLEMFDSDRNAVHKGTPTVSVRAG